MNNTQFTAVMALIITWGYITCAHIDRQWEKFYASPQQQWLARAVENQECGK